LHCLRLFGGGILRLYFAVTFTAGPGSIKVVNNDVSKGFLNADNSSEIADSGYYRFDIDVEGGDLINIQAGEELASILFVRAHLIPFGA